MADYPVAVSYDPATGWAFNPTAVEAAAGIDSISFLRSPKEQQWTFVGISVWGPGTTKPASAGSVCSPFYTSAVNDSNITLLDDNQARSLQTFQYAVWIRLPDNLLVWSDPQIINKGP